MNFQALKNRNYRLFFGGQLVSVIGNGMQLMVQAWLVYRLTHSAYWLGIISFSSQVPAFLASPFAGVVADHVDRKRILLWVQIVGMLQSFALATLVFTHSVQVWQVALLSAVLGILNAFEITTRHAFSVDLVGKKDLNSAISLNAATTNSSRILGPALGGILLVPLGEGWCFVINGLSYLAVVYCLSKMDLQTTKKKIQLTQSLNHLGDAIRYLKTSPLIQRFMVLATFIAFVGFSYSVLLPVVAKETLHGDSGTFAWLSGATGLGAITGAIILGRTSLVEDVYRKIFTYISLMGLAFVLLGLSSITWLSILAMFLIGFFMMGSFPILNTVIQNLVTDPMRGRIMSIYTMTFFGATPIGSLLVGFLADRIGTQTVAVASGAICVTFGLLAPKAFGEYKAEGMQVQT